MDQAGGQPVPPKLPRPEWFRCAVPSRQSGYHQRTQQRLLQQSQQFSVGVGDKSQLFPQEFRQQFAGQKLAIFGDGDWYHGWNSLEYRLNLMADGGGVNRWIYDPKYLVNGQVSPQALIAAGRDPQTVGTVIASTGELPGEVAACIFSPNRFHVGSLEEMMSLDQVTGIYLEKPAAINLAELVRLDQALSNPQKPVFFGDHYIYAASGLLALMGQNVIYPQLLEVGYDPFGLLQKALDQKQPLLGKITRVEARSTFRGSDHLLKDRGWLEKASEGGGVLLDLAVHQANVLHTLGLEVEEVEQADLRIRPETTESARGIYVPIAEGSDLAEDYAQVTGRIRGGGQLRLTVAQFADDPGNDLVLADEQGRCLRLNYADRTVQFLQQGELLGELRCPADPALLLMHHALSYFRSGDKEPMFYQEQRASIELVESIKKVGLRSHEPL